MPLHGSVTSSFSNSGSSTRSSLGSTSIATRSSLGGASDVICVQATQVVIPPPVPPVVIPVVIVAPPPPPPAPPVNLVQNGSFETNYVGVDSWGNLFQKGVTSWIIDGGTPFYQSNNFSGLVQSQDGKQAVIFLDTCIIHQNVVIPAAKNYTLQFYYRKRPDVNFNLAALKVSINGTTVAAVTSNSTSWALSSTVVSLSASTINLKIEYDSSVARYGQMEFDSVSLTEI